MKTTLSPAIPLPPVAMTTMLICYTALNVGLAYVMPFFPALGLIGAFVVNIVVLLFFRPDLALAAYILVASPSVGLSLGSGILSRLYIGNLLFALVMLIWILKMVLPRRQSGHLLVDRVLLRPLIILNIIGLISIIYSRLCPDPNVPYQYPHSNVSLTLVNLSEMVLLIGLPMFLALIPGIVHTTRHTYTVIGAYVVTGLLYALGTIFASPLNLYSKQVLLGVRRPEVFGVVSSGLGTLILLFGSIAFAQALYVTYLRDRLIWGVLSLVFALGVIMTFGRESWLGMFLAVLLMVTLRTKNWSVLLLLLVPLILLITPGVSDFFDPTKTYGSDRFQIWRDAFNIWLHSPYFGVGAGNFQFFDRVYGTDQVGIAHNQYLQMLAEMGIQGLLCLIWFLAATGYKTWQCYNSARSRLGKSVALAYIGFYIAIVFGGLFTGSLIPSAASGGGTGPFVEASYRWMLLGLVLSVPNWDQEALEKEQGQAQLK